MKKAILFAAALFVAVASFAQNEYNYQKRSLFEQLPIRGNDIVFLGNSITDGCEWAELFNNRHIKNRGISADRSGWLLDRLDPIVNGHPKKLFLMIGTNDLAAGVSPEEVAANIGKLLDRFAEESPWTKIYVQSILPVNGVDTKAKAKNHWKKGAEIIEANKLIEALCEGRKNVLYIDVYSALVDQNGARVAYQSVRFQDFRHGDAPCRGNRGRIRGRPQGVLHARFAQAAGRGRDAGRRPAPP